MVKGAGELQTINYKQMLPWVYLFRAFRIAVDVRKMILAALGLLALSAGDWGFSHLPFAPKSTGSELSRAWPWEEDLGYELMDGAFLEDPWNALLVVSTNWQLVLRPMRTFVEPGSVLFQTGSSWSDVAFAWTRLFWALLVWAIFGGAITRMAAVQFARNEKIGLTEAFQFSWGKFLPYVSAPLLAVAGIGMFWVLCLFGGLIGRIPFIGEILVGALWGLPLVLGFVMSLILMGVAVGWPLMYAAVSTEGSDAFDGFSRAYSFVYSRPWHYLWFAIVVMAFGSVVCFFVSMVAGLLVHLAEWSVAAGMGPEHVGKLFHAAPKLIGGTRLMAETTNASLASFLTGIWLRAVALLVVGFVYSYFWSASTIMYFLLRQSDDNTDLDEVYLPEASEPPDKLLPLVGVAASEQPVVERLAEGEFTMNAKGEVYQGDTEMDIKMNDTSLPQ